jgi:uncharacterized membrane protein YuzA (DUF378 family)
MAIEGTAPPGVDVTYGHRGKFQWILLAHTSAGKAWLRSRLSDVQQVENDGPVLALVTYAQLQGLTGSAKQFNLVVEMAHDKVVSRWERIMYHVAGIAALSLVAALLTLAYHADKGTAFVMVGLAILPGIPAWHYLHGRRPSR